MQAVLLKNLKKRVSDFYVSDKYFALIDEENRVLFFSKDLSLKKGFKIKLSPNKADNSTKFSYNGKYIGISNENKLSIFDLEAKKIISQINHPKSILCVAFDKENRYLSFGDTNNEVFLFNIKAKNKISVATHKDFILDIDFCEDDNELIGGCYDKGVLFVNLADFSKSKRYLHMKKVKKVESKKFNISADEISNIIKWNVLKNDLEDKVSFYKEFRDFYVYENILLILTSSKIILYDLEKEVILNDNFLEVQNADKLVVIDRYLIVSLKNGLLYYYDLLEEEKEFLDAILSEDFKKAYTLLDKNPFLKRSKGYEKLEKLVELKIKIAKKLFEIDPIKAKLSLSKLLEIPFLRERIQNIIDHYTHLIKLKKAIENNNFSLAYQLVNTYPLLKETKYYKLLEKKWEIAFEKAFKLAYSGKIDEAKKILQPFLGIPQKSELIELVLKKATILKLAREKLAKRDFKGFFVLVKNHPELKNTKEYQKVIEYGEKLLQKANEFLKNEEFEKAKKAATILSEIEPFHNKAVKIMQKIEIALKFLHYLSNNQIQKAFELVKLYPFLKELKEYKQFTKKFRKDIYEAEILLADSKKEEANKLLQSYQDDFHKKRVSKVIDSF